MHKTYTIPTKAVGYHIVEALMILMSAHAHLCAGGEDDKWGLKRTSYGVAVSFDRSTDLRRFDRTFARKHAQFLRQHDLDDSSRDPDRNKHYSCAW